MRDGIIIIVGILALLFGIATILLIDSPQLCFEIKGIDHNKNNDPFTIFIGDC